MKYLSPFCAFVTCLFWGLLSSGTASAQCSGQFSVSYPQGSGTGTTNFNNGSGSPTISFCPDGSGQVTLTVTEASSGGNFTVLNGSGGSVFSRDFTTPGETFTFQVPVSAVTRYTFVNTITCQNNKNLTFDFTLQPSISLTSSAASSGVCAGSTVRLTATGGAANNPVYTFFANGQQIGSNSTGILDVTPQASTTYTVSTAVAACNGSTATQAINVVTNNLTLTSSTASTTTPGTPVTLTATGGTAGSYTYTAFTNGTTTTLAGTGSSVTVSPTTTTRYTVTGPTAVGGCPSSAVVQVQVGNTPLPVGLTSFTAIRTNEASQLRWVTAFELNNSHFEIERSLDGADFRSVGRVAGTGTTSGTSTNYSFSDATSAPAGVTTLYYRLRQVDFSGDATLSGVRVVAVAGVTPALGATVFPNPATDFATVRFLSANAGPVTLEVRNVLGQQLLLKTVTAQPGLMEISLPEAAAWPAGMHYLILDQNQQRQVLRLNHQ